METIAILMRLSWTLLMLILIGGSDAVPANNRQTERGIVFPKNENYDECFLDDRQLVRGTCKMLGECASALERWDKLNIPPKTCYFHKFDHFVCCAKPGVMVGPNTYSFEPPPSLAKRPSERACELMQGPKVAVVHGDPTAPKEFPFMAALGWRSNVDDLTIYRCGGALISKKFVLTAAHCVDLGGEPPYVVRLGGVNLTEPNVEDIRIRSIKPHPDYNAASSYNDIALIELERNATEGAVCVWTEKEFEQNNVTAIGYGHTRFAGISSDQLLKAPLFLVSNDICQSYFEPGTDFLQNGVASSHVCAGDPEKLRDTCQGDSGGPIVMKAKRYDKTVTFVVGITSFGQGCAGGPPSIYTRISSYINWIESIVWPAFDVRTGRMKEALH